MDRTRSAASDASLREVARGASTAFVVRIAGSVLGLASSLIVARSLGAEGSGIYYLAMSVVVTASTIGRLGLDTAAVRHVASYASEGNWLAVDRTVGISLKVVLGVSIGMSIALAFAAPWLSHHVFRNADTELPLMLAAVAVAPFAVSFVIADALRGLKQIMASQLIKTVFSAMLTLVFIYPAANVWGANGAVLSYTAAVVITGGLGWLLWRRGFTDAAGMARTPAGAGSEMNAATLLSSSWPLFGVALSALVIDQCATLLLGIWSSADDVGIFSVASRIAGLLMFPLLAMISILSPKFAAMHQAGDLAGLRRLARQSSFALTTFVVPATCVVFLYAAQILSFFGAQFVPGTPVLRILLLGVVINVSTGAVAEILMMSGYGDSVRNITGSGAVMLALLGWLLIPAYGSLGAAVAVTVSMVALNVAMVFMVRRRLGFNPVTLFSLRDSA